MSTTIFQINASLFSGQGQSSQLAERFVQAQRERAPDTQLIRRDLAVDPVPHLDAARFTAFITPPEQRTLEQQAYVDYSDELIDELRRADTIVIGLPMYNFGVPSTLKAWIDHVARAGVTFRYTAQGPVGLLTGKKAYVFAARGGAYQGTPRDSQTAYLRDFLRFIGIEEVEFVYAEGLNMGETAKVAGLARAHEAIRSLTPPAALAA